MKEDLLRLKNIIITLLVFDICRKYISYCHWAEKMLEVYLFKYILVLLNYFNNFYYRYIQKKIFNFFCLRLPAKKIVYETNFHFFFFVSLVFLPFKQNGTFSSRECTQHGFPLYNFPFAFFKSNLHFELIRHF